jgi:hypothetical protein
VTAQRTGESATNSSRHLEILTIARGYVSSNGEPNDVLTLTVWAALSACGIVAIRRLFVLGLNLGLYTRQLFTTCLQGLPSACDLMAVTVHGVCSMTWAAIPELVYRQGRFVAGARLSQWGIEQADVFERWSFK